MVLFAILRAPHDAAHCLLAHKSEQPTAGWIPIFHKYKRGAIIRKTNLNLRLYTYKVVSVWIYEIFGGMLLICQNATVRVCGAWINIHYVLC